MCVGSLKGGKKARLVRPGGDGVEEWRGMQAVAPRLVSCHP